MDLNQLANSVHKANAKWWVDLETGLPLKRNKGELLALMHSEVSEAFDGMIRDEMDDKLPHRKAHEVEVADCFIRTLDYSVGFNYRLEEIDDFFSRGEEICKSLPKEESGNLNDHGLMTLHSQISKILESERKSKLLMAEQHLNTLILFILVYCWRRDLDLKGAFEEKMLFNAARIDHSHAHRKSEDGKKF